MALMNYREANQVLWRGCRPAHNGTQIEAEIFADNGTETIYSSPLNEVSYITTIIITIKLIAAGSVALQHTNSLSAVITRLTRRTIIAAVDASPIVITFWPPFELIDQEKLRVYSSAAGLQVSAWATGWHE